MSEKFTGPLFIVGLSRSGTKLIRDLINRNNYVSVPENESHFIPKILSKSLSVHDAHQYISKTLFVKRQKQLPFPSLEYLKKVGTINSTGELIENILKYYAPENIEKWSTEIIWGDKTPLYLRHIDIIKKYFPTCKIIHIIRDPRDRAISVKKTWGKSMYRTTEKWRNELENAEKWRNDKSFFFEFKYEELINEPKIKLSEICEFLNIPFQQEMLQLKKPSEKHGDTSNKTTVDKKNTSKYLDFNSSTIKRIEEIALPMMEEFGYTPLYAKKHKKFSPIMMEVLKYSDFIHFKISNKIKGY